MHVYLDDAGTCWKALEDVGGLVLGGGVVGFGGTGRWVVAPLWFCFCFGLRLGVLRRPFLSWISEFPAHRISMSVNHWHPKPALNPETSKKE
jgi:hypothetical protein